MNEYFKKIAETHKEILHTIDYPAYFREYSSSRLLINNSDFLTNLRNARDIILVSQFNGDMRGNTIDNNSAHETGAIFLLKRVNIGNFEEIDQARDTLDQIWLDILAKIKKNIRESELLIFDFDWQKMPLGAIGDNYYGLAIMMSFDRIECANYDVSKWN